MAEAKINESCIIGMPECGYAFSSSRMAFIATPADGNHALELDVFENILAEKNFETFIALQNSDPANNLFCTKICSKIIASQFCIVLLNSSSHEEHKEIKMPNPNVYFEYGLMLGFKKHILPFLIEGDVLASNIGGFDTIMYNKSRLKEYANREIDKSIRQTRTISMPTGALFSSRNEKHLTYTNILGLRVSQLNTDVENYLNKLGNQLGFLLLDGRGGIVYFGLFEYVPSKKIISLLRSLLQEVDFAKKEFETITKMNMTEKQVENVYHILNHVRAEVVVSNEVDKKKITDRITELTTGLEGIPWKLVNGDDIDETIGKEYEEIGEI